MSTVTDSTDAILQRAEERGRQQGVPYAGLVTPTEAHALTEAGVATLVDVRTRFEAEYVGRVPDTPLIEWKALDAPAPDPGFVKRVEALPGRRDVLLFMCRSGARSHMAAAAVAAAGHAKAFNVLEGFEGGLDADKHRGSLGGWRKARLPWVQG